MTDSDRILRGLENLADNQRQIAQRLVSTEHDLARMREKVARLERLLDLKEGE